MCLVVVVLLSIPGDVAAYHEFDPPVGSPPKLVWQDPPPVPVQEGFEPKVAVADYAGMRYVYTAWWFNDGVYWQMLFRRLVSPGGEGDGTWSDPQRILDLTGTPNTPAYRDIAIAAYANQVFVAWTRTPAPSRVVVARSTDNGATFTQVWEPAVDPAFEYFEPDLVVTDQFAHLARVRFSGTTAKRVEVVRLSPLPELVHAFGDNTEWPTLAAHGSDVMIAFQQCTNCADPATLHVYATWCTSDFTICVPTGKVSEGAATPSGAPDLASFGKHVHIVWQAGGNVVYQRGKYTSPIQSGGDPPWDPSTRFVVSPTVGIPDRHSKYGVAAYGYGVAVAYLTDATLPQLRRNLYNGQSDQWQTPEDLDCSTWCDAGEVDIAVDARHELAGEKGNILQYVWSRHDGSNGGYWHGIAHRRVPTEERERQATRFLPTDLTVAQGQATVMGSQFAYLFGGDIPNPTDRIWRYDPSQEILPPEDTGHRLWQPISHASAVWTGTKAVIFWGRTADPPLPMCVQVYTGSSNPFCVSLAQLQDRYGTSAVYDGTRYAYVFGGKNSAGSYLDTITKWDAQTDLEASWGACPPPTLPFGLAFSSAVWHPGEGVAYVFGGERAGIAPTYSPRNSYMVWRFDLTDPTCPGGHTVSFIPCVPWDPCGTDDQASVRPGPGTVAVYAGDDVILVAGGRHLFDPVLGGTFADSPYIWGFWTVAHVWGLKFVDLPACKSFGSGVWYSGRLYYFGGYKDPDWGLCAGGGDQVVRYDLGTH